MKDSARNMIKTLSESNSNLSEKMPYGKDAVKKAILNASRKLLLKRSPSEITIREIAKLAKVKHPLIYRHFGTKEKLIVEALTGGLTQIADKKLKFETLEGNVGLFYQVAKNNKFRIALARAMVAGIDPQQMQDQFPMTQKLLELMKKRQTELKKNGKFEVEFLTAALTAFALGWMLYEPFVSAATGLSGKNKVEMDDKIVALLEEFIDKIC